MLSRRECFQRIAATSLFGTTASQVARAAVSAPSDAPEKRRKVAPSPLSRIKSVVPREETILRLGGDCQCLSITWTADDRQLINIGDSNGWPSNAVDRYTSTSLFSVHGDPPDVTFRDVRTYPKLLIWDWFKQNPTVWPYFGSDLLAVGNRIYECVFTSAHFAIDRNGKTPDAVWNGWAGWGAHPAAKLIYSPNGGQDWHNMDGSTPVVWEEPSEQTRERMLFIDEPQDAFGHLHFVQMGKGYQDNRDGYVYVHSTNGTGGGYQGNATYLEARAGDKSDAKAHTTRPRELVMARVPKERILDRSAYEFFAGLSADGRARWSKDIQTRGVVLDLSSGVNVPGGWDPMIVYNAPLGVFMMVNVSAHSAGGGISKPARFYVGVWIAPNPWGPWSQIYADTDWKPAGDPGARPGRLRIAPKWISKDGRSFWWTWCDAQHTIGVTDANELDMYHVHNLEEFKRERFRFTQNHPYWAFNTQRVDLLLD